MDIEHGRAGSNAIMIGSGLRTLLLTLLVVSCAGEALRIEVRHPGFEAIRELRARLDQEVSVHSVDLGLDEITDVLAESLGFPVNMSPSVPLDIATQVVPIALPDVRVRDALHHICWATNTRWGLAGEGVMLYGPDEPVPSFQAAIVVDPVMRRFHLADGELLPLISTVVGLGNAELAGFFFSAPPAILRIDGDDSSLQRAADLLQWLVALPPADSLEMVPRWPQVPAIDQRLRERLEEKVRVLVMDVDAVETVERLAKDLGFPLVIAPQVRFGERQPISLGDQRVEMAAQTVLSWCAVLTKTSWSVDHGAVRWHATEEIPVRRPWYAVPLPLGRRAADHLDPLREDLQEIEGDTARVHALGSWVLVNGGASALSLVKAHCAQMWRLLGHPVPKALAAGGNGHSEQAAPRTDFWSPGQHSP